MKNGIEVQKGEGRNEWISQRTSRLVFQKFWIIACSLFCVKAREETSNWRSCSSILIGTFAYFFWFVDFYHLPEYGELQKKHRRIAVISKENRILPLSKILVRLIFFPLNLKKRKLKKALLWKRKHSRWSKIHIEGASTHFSTFFFFVFHPPASQRKKLFSLVPTLSLYHFQI